MHADQTAQKLWPWWEPALYFSKRLNQIVRHPQMRFSEGSAASRRTPTVLTSFPVLARVIYALNACTCSAGRWSVLSGIRSPGRATLVSLNARAVAPCWGMASGCGCVAKKRGLWVHLSLEASPWSTGCSSDSAIGCGAARYSPTYCRKAKGKDPDALRQRSFDCSTNIWKPVCCFPRATEGSFLLKCVYSISGCRFRANLYVKLQLKQKLNRETVKIRRKKS